MNDIIVTILVNFVGMKVKGGRGKERTMFEFEILLYPTLNALTLKRGAYKQCELHFQLLEIIRVT